MSSCRDGIFWTRVKITGYGDRVVPYYRAGHDNDMVFGIIARGAEKATFKKTDVFDTVEEARAASGVDRVFCFKHSSSEHFDTVHQIHKNEGLVCPNCGPGTALVELDRDIFKEETDKGRTHFCFSDHKSIVGKTHQYQVTLGERKGCAKHITLELKSSKACNCGAPIVDHVPGGSYCWRTLDKKRKFL